MPAAPEARPNTATAGRRESVDVLAAGCGLAGSPVSNDILPKGNRCAFRLLSVRGRAAEPDPHPPGSSPDGVLSAFGPAYADQDARAFASGYRILLAGD